MRHLLIYSFLSSVFLLGSALYGQSGPELLEKLFTEIQTYDRSLSPFREVSRGKHPQRFPAQTWESFQKQSQKYQNFQERLEAISNEQLNKQERISKMIMQMRLKDQISNIQYKVVLIPFNAEGGFYNSLSYSLSYLPFNHADDFQAYLQWLPLYLNFLKENQALMKQGIKEKIMAPKVIVQNTLKLLKPWLASNINEHPLYQPFVNNTSPAVKEYENEFQDLFKNKILPTYQDLYNFIETEYQAAAPSKVGISHIPQGMAYYENRVKHYTTLDISPDSVFNLGIQEVKRIRKAMEQIIQELEFEGDFASFLAFLRTDKQFYPTSAQALIRYASWLSKQAEGQLPKYFSKLYTLPFTVEPVPDAIAPTYTTGRYVRGDYERRRPGIYWVNTYQLTSRTLYTMPALTLHEAVPGHHLQIALAAELKDLPPFRKSYYISAFGEGWGLYSEYLGEEMGMYTTPYELFGRYTYEMWRACRLVVDVGMHAKDWTREQAVKFMAENTALSIHEVNTEIDRYIGWPGQALSYKVGEIKIKSLRKKSEEVLGDKFNIQDFHHAVLKNGAVPLTVLESEVEAYVQGQKD